MSRWICAALAVLLAVPSAWAVYGGDRGKRPAALDACDEHWDRGRRAEARRCYTSLTAASSDLFTRAEAWRALGNVRQANDLFREAVKQRPDDPDIRVRWGYLYLETHNEQEALNLFNEALEIDKDHVPAKLGVVSVQARRFEDKAKELVKETLETQPDQILGHLLIARMALEEGEMEKADEELDTALEKAERLGRSPLEAYSLKASADLLRGVTDSEWTKKALERNPAYGRIYADVAHFYVITRRYREAVELLQRAVRLDPELWSAHADLGVNLLRENRDEEGKRHLEIAYEGDPFSAKTVNTLRLLDSFDNFRVYSNKDLAILESEEDALAALDKPEIIVRLHKKEAELLKPYVFEIAEKSVETFSKKYRFKPERPIYVELYPDHDDFAVRTMALPGIGLLGVTFGYLVAMDSPSARPPGQFHWGTTLWHEMAHVFTLEATNHLVPRWYSEGISMYEEWEARPTWGERISPDFVSAFNDGKLLPVAELDKGFIRPSYPSQIPVSYFQAGLVCQMIDRQWGAEKLAGILEAFGKSASTEEAIRGVLGVEPEEFDERFEEFVKDRLGLLAAKSGFKTWREKLKEAMTAARDEDWDKAVPTALEAKKLYPEYVEEGSPYVLLAEAYEVRGDRAAARRELEGYLRNGGRNPERIKKLAEWQDEAGSRAAAIDTLEELLYIRPGDEELHSLLGDWLLSEGRESEAAREFQSLLAAGPHDKASAHYRLAEAYHKMKDSKRARRHVLQALEVAPTYVPAQKLLLEIAR